MGKGLMSIMLSSLMAAGSLTDIVAGELGMPKRPSRKELQSNEEKEYMLEKARAKRERKAVKRSNNVQ